MRSGGTLTLDAYDDFGPAPNVISNDLTVAAGGTITHSGPAASENAKVHLAVFGGMTVEEGGAVSVNGKGYLGEYPAGASGGTMYGAAHAGYANANNVTLEPYGSIFCPTNWGASPAQISGGGAVHLVVAGNLAVNGGISADGAWLYIENGAASSPYATKLPMAADGDVAKRYANVNLVLGNGGWVTVPRDSTNVPQKIRLRSLSMTSPTSILDLGANTFVVTDPACRRNKDWAPGATVNVSEYNKVPGKILWPPRGFVLILK